jgi:hypothetical protein
MHLKYYTIFFLVIFYLNSAISQSNIDKDKDKTVDDSDILYNYDSVLVSGITITEKPYKAGDLTMTQNQYKIMPASFQDPARILIKYPGFSTPNDGANGIVFRGLAPETNRWQLFGADIVNPNHLSNAGTANDLSTESAGGVNAFSGSVLGHYHFEANPSETSKGRSSVRHFGYETGTQDQFFCGF